MLAEAEQIRKEADNIGPRAELEHWKKRTSKFNFLLEQLKTHKVRAVLGILHIAKSKLIPVSVANMLVLNYCRKNSTTNDADWEVSLRHRVNKNPKYSLDTLSSGRESNPS